MGTSDRRQEEEKARKTLCADRSRVPAASCRDPSSEMSRQQVDGLRPVTPDAAEDALKVRETPSTPSSVVPSDGDEDPSAPSPSSGNQLPDGCRTPSSEVFDSFAPGPDDLNMAPKRNSRSGKTFPALTTTDIWGSLGKSRVSRVLHFDDDNDDDDVGRGDVDRNHSDNGRHEATAGKQEEMDFVESVYEDLLKVILSNQSDDRIVKNGETASPETPKCENTWINSREDACPNAPIKPRSRGAVASATFASLCRKLQF
ncbi:unnamed protein product [Victoria cruziana]